jgi:predicted acyl esterase
MQNLKDKGDGLKASPDAKVPEAYLFETGTNQWRRFETWPPKEAVEKTLWLDAGGKLAWQAPSETGTDEYVSDPDKPVPVIGEIGPGMAGDYMTYDQRFASATPRCARLSDRSARSRRHHHGPGNFGPARIHDRHGFRFHRQTH